VDLEPLGELGERRLGRLASRVGDEPDDVRLARSGRRRRARRSRRAGGRGAPPARWRFADSALRTRFRSPRAPARPGAPRARAARPPAPIRRRNVPTVSPLFHVTTPPRARPATTPATRHPARRAARTAASAARTTNSRWASPAARLSEPAARKRPRSQASRQCSAALPQSNAADASISLPSRTRVVRARSRWRFARGDVASAAASARRSHGRVGSIAASSIRIAVTSSRSARLTGEGRPTGDRRPTPERSSGAPCDARPPARAVPLDDPGDRRGELERVVVVRVVGVDDVVEDELGDRRDLRRPAQANRFGRPFGRDPRGELVVPSTTSTSPGALWATSASTWSARSRPLVSPICVATLQTKMRSAGEARTLRGCRARAGSAGGSCRGCPGR
jgi:hypothetical protein